MTPSARPVKIGRAWFGERTDGLYFTLPSSHHSVPRWTSNLAVATPFGQEWVCRWSLSSHGITVLPRYRSSGR